MEKKETTVEEWEKEFELRFQNWRKDPNFWEQDMVDFIRSLLTTREAEVVERVREIAIREAIPKDECQQLLVIPKHKFLVALTEKHNQENV
jgi:hypothetical protein